MEANATASNTTIAPADLEASIRLKTEIGKQTIIQKVVALLSAAGSAYIVYKLVFDVRDATDRKKKLNRTFDRLMLCLCVSDVVSSISIFLGSWSIPANPTNVYDYEQQGEAYLSWDEKFPHAVGTPGTCTAQGFFLYLGMWSSWLFTACISLSILFQVKFEFRQKRMRVAEKCFIAVSILIPLAMAIFGLVKQGYLPNTGYGWCAFSTDYSKLFTYVCGFTAMLTVIICMGMLFWTVRKKELRAKRWSTNAANGKYQKRVFVKGMLYIGVFVFLWVPVLVVIFVAPRSLNLVFSIFIPSQGMFNVLIYSDLFGVLKERAESAATFIRTSVLSIRNSSRLSFGSSRKRTKFEEKLDATTNSKGSRGTHTKEPAMGSNDSGQIVTDSASKIETKPTTNVDDVDLEDPIK